MAILKVANVHFDAAGTTRLQANGANVLTIVTGNTEDARFDASGNLLIGHINSTVGQGVKLDVAGAVNASAVLINGAPALTGGITSNVVISVSDNTNAALRITQTGTGEALRVEDSTNPDNTPFVVDASGNVGIGSTVTDVKLKIVTNTQSTDGIALLNGSGGAILLMPNTGSGSYSPLVSANDQAIIAYGTTTDTGNLVLGIWSSTAKGIKIQNSGNVLIGRSTSTVGQGVILDVNGAINASAVLVNGASILTTSNSYTVTVGTAGNAYAQAVGTAGNNYTITVGAAANGWANTISATRSTASNAYAETIGAASNTIAVAAFAKANATTYTSNVVISVADNTNAALRITQTGTGEAFRVEDSANPDATPFVIDASGNVGIGTSSPAAKLHVQDNFGTGISGILINGSTDQFANGLAIGPSGHATSRRSSLSFDNWIVGQDSIGNGTKDFFIYGGTSPAERFNIGTAGAVTIAGATQTTGLGVGTAPSATTGEIRATNNITAYYSDKRLKKNINKLENALRKLEQISGVTFQSNEEAEKYGYTDKKVQVGVIAQEVEAVLPEVVVPAPFDIAIDEDGNEYSKSGENYKTVQYEKLIPLLIEAIKELKAEVDMLKGN